MAAIAADCKVLFDRPALLQYKFYMWLKRTGFLLLGLWLGSGCGRSIPEVVGPCNGSEDLCDRPYDQIAFATAHNSMSSADQGWLKPCQQHGIARQLQDGARGLMLDAHYYRGMVMLCHYVCEIGGTNFGMMPLKDALADIKKFLDENRNEVVTIIFESFVSSDDIAANFKAAGLSGFLYSQKPGRGWPTLGSMVGSGRRLVVFTNNGGGSPGWYHPEWDYCWETEPIVESIEHFNCRPKQGSQDNDLFILNHFLKDPFCSEELSRETNVFDLLYERVDSCWEETGQMPNFVAVDFYNIGGVMTVVDWLNR